MRAHSTGPRQPAASEFDRGHHSPGTGHSKSNHRYSRVQLEVRSSPPNLRRFLEAWFEDLGTNGSGWLLWKDKMPFIPDLRQGIDHRQRL